MALGVADDCRTPAVCLHDRTLRNSVDGVIGAFAVHVGFEQRQEPTDVRVAKDDHVGDAAQPLTPGVTGLGVVGVRQQVAGVNAALS